MGFSRATLNLLKKCCRKNFQISSLLKSENKKKNSSLLKPKNDSKEYKLITLENGMTVTLVSDVTNLISLDDDKDKVEEPEGNSIKLDGKDNPIGRKLETILNGNYEKKAACALCIGAGYFSDPPEVPGLAHLLEHIVSKGSAKYPEENGFIKFVTNHGGIYNAETDMESTTFYFTCHGKHLKEGIDRFAHCFISPLLKNETMIREREVVHSEYEMSRSTTKSCRGFIISSFAPTDHPVRQFSPGNLTTLKDNISDEALHKKVQEFFTYYYSAHRMALVVQASLPLDTLACYVRKAFSAVPNNNLPSDNFDKYIGTFGYQNFNKLIFVVPLESNYSVSASWILPSYRKEYKALPFDYVGWLLESEDEGSLISYLRRNDLALECIAKGTHQCNSIFSMYTVGFFLTEKGYQHLEDVLEALFSCISMLKKKGPDERIYNELKKIYETYFRFNQQPSLLNVKYMAQSILFVEPEDCITGDSLFLEYKPELITEVLEQLSPERALIMAHSVGKPGDFYNQIEPWLGTPYRIEEIPEKWKRKWADCSLENVFHIPRPNLYLPTDFSIKNPPKKIIRYPVKVINDELLELWFLQDVKFKTPIAYYYFCIISSFAEKNPLNEALLGTLCDFISVKFVEDIYSAGQAGLKFKALVGPLGLELLFDGYNEKLPLLFCKIANLTRQYCQDIKNEENLNFFNAIKMEKLREHYKRLSNVETVAMMALQSILLEKFNTDEEVLAAVDEITLDDLHEFAGEFISKAHILGLIQGNITEQEAIALCANFKEIIGFSPLSEAKFNNKVTKLNNGELYLRLKSFDTDIFSFVVNYYQVGPASLRTSCVMEIILMLMMEPLHHSLRTEQQIGYQVQCNQETFLKNVEGFCIRADFRINKFHPDEVDERIELFLAQFLKVLKEMSESEIEEAKALFIASNDYPDLRQDVHRNFPEIIMDECMFDRSEKAIVIIPEITKEEMCEWFEAHIKYGKEFKKLSIQVVGGSEGPDVIQEKTSGKGCGLKIMRPIRDIQKASFITDIDEYKKTRQFYPEKQ